MQIKLAKIIRENVDTISYIYIYIYSYNLITPYLTVFPSKIKEAYIRPVFKKEEK